MAQQEQYIKGMVQRSGFKEEYHARVRAGEVYLPHSCDELDHRRSRQCAAVDCGSGGRVETMTQVETFVVAIGCGVVVALALVSVLWISLIAHLDAYWRPIIRAYLEARARAAGTVMQVEEPGGTPGKLYAPTTPEADEE